MPSISIPAALAIGGATTLGSSLIGANAAQNAASTQAQAAQQAAQLQYQAEQNALGFQKDVFNTTQANQRPFLQAGQGAISNLAAMTGPGGSLIKGYPGTFQAPTAAQAAATPGYQFQLQQGEEALQRSAAAQGNLLSGGTLTGIENYAQGLASTDYQNAYERALQGFNTNYNVWANNQANAYNRLANLAGLGQTSAAQLGQTGTQAANINANTLLGAASAIGQAQQNAAAATASGYVGAANAYGGGLSNLANLALLPSILKYGGGGGGGGPSYDLGPYNPTIPNYDPNVPPPNLGPPPTTPMPTAPLPGYNGP